ncbi:FecR family protein [Chitinophaga ginsengisoli]|uniref:FecR family protein n=1 Tax=Chitinophaga ginsengisoli TaxID=363837 RepID=A0A2P8FTB4_9BACT|nr:FecR family protein [Chitinophaga ginsengisoli]PSL24966.1 FecR family protein [Chitinophaga ginsengisoli]
MDQNVFTSLLDKYIDGSISTAEKVQFAHLMELPENRELLEHALQDAMLTDKYLFPLPASETNRFIEQFTTQVHELPPAPVRPIYTYRRWAAAAAVLLLLGTGAYFWYSRMPASRPIASNAQVRPLHDATPGVTGAVLTLDDGRQVELDSTGNGVIANQNGTKVLLRKGQLDYESGSGSTGISYNTMTTPRGRQFKLVLPDGTKVWLNAASSLKYPTAFTGNERKVEITGEAYLEVAQHADKPFILTAANNVTIKVLGTSFNVNAYADENAVHTTLVTGSVQVAAVNGDAVTLQPGKEARLQKKTGKFSVLAADEEQVLAWKNGYFYFDRADIQTIMRQIARWYDVEVEYKEIPDKKFSGTIPRNVNASQVFKILELTGNVHFTIDGNKVIVRS